MGKAIVKAPIAKGPTPQPTKIVSTRLYKAIAIIPTAAGKDRFNNNLPIFSSPSLAAFLLILLLLLTIIIVTY